MFDQGIRRRALRARSLVHRLGLNTGVQALLLIRGWLSRAIVAATVAASFACPPAFADNSSSCVAPVTANLGSGRSVITETFDARGDEDYYRFQVTTQGTVVARLLRDTTTNHLRPRFAYLVLDAGCADAASRVTILSEYTNETLLILQVNTPGSYVLIVTGEGTSRAVGERYRLVLGFSPPAEVQHVQTTSIGREAFSLGIPLLATVAGQPVSHEISTTVPLNGVGIWEGALRVAGSGVMVATIESPSRFRASFTRQNDSSWSVLIGWDHPATATFYADGSLNKDLTLQVRLTSRTSVPLATTLRLTWIPLCAAREFDDGSSIGCPTLAMAGDLPEFARLRLRTGLRLVATFEVEDASAGPVRILTHDSQFDPLIRIFSVDTLERLGFDQDDGQGAEAMWSRSLTPGRYAVDIVDQSGYGSGDTSLAVEQSLEFLDDPGEYPDPPSDTAPSQCLASDVTLTPNNVLEGSFDSRLDLDAILVTLPQQPGVIDLWVVGGSVQGSLRDPYHNELPPLVVNSEMGYPFGIVRSVDGSGGKLCVVLSHNDKKTEPYLLGFTFWPFQSQASASQPATKSSTCTVPSRAWLDPSIRQTASCETAWRAYVGRKMAQTKLSGVRTLFEMKLEMLSADPLSAESKSYLAVAGALADLLGTTSSLVPLEAAYALPNVILQTIETDGQLEAAILQITQCLNDGIVALVTYHVTGELELLSCTSDIAQQAIVHFLQSYLIEEAQKEFEREVLAWSFLEEYFALGSLSALEARYNATGSAVLKVMADRKGLLGSGLFDFWETDRDTYIAQLHNDALDFARQAVEPVVQRKLGQP